MGDKGGDAQRELLADIHSRSVQWLLNEGGNSRGRASRAQQARPEHNNKNTHVAAPTAPPITRPRPAPSPAPAPAPPANPNERVGAWRVPIRLEVGGGGGGGGGQSRSAQIAVAIDSASLARLTSPRQRPWPAQPSGPEGSARAGEQAPRQPVFAQAGGARDWRANTPEQLRRAGQRMSPTSMLRIRSDNSDDQPKAKAARMAHHGHHQHRHQFVRLESGEHSNTDGEDEGKDGGEDDGEGEGEGECEGKGGSGREGVPRAGLVATMAAAAAAAVGAESQGARAPPDPAAAAAAAPAPAPHADVDSLHRPPAERPANQQKRRRGHGPRNLPHKCQHCTMAFAKPSWKERHERTHTGERPFPCPHPGCNKAFSRSDRVTVHLRTHSRQRRFVCDVCGLAFPQAVDVAQHRLVHLQGAAE